MARTRALWNFFRIHAGFRTLPNEALAQLVAGLERVEVAAGALVIREGDPPGPMYVVEEGRLRNFRTEGGVGAQPRLPPQGRRLRRARHCSSASRAPPPSRRSTTARCFGSTPELFESLLADQPDFRSRIEERVLQYDYRRLARVPLDFADEILPAEVSAEEQRAAEESWRPSRSRSKSSEPLRRPSRRRAGRRFPHVFQLDEMDCGAACLAMVCRFYGRAVPVSYIREIAHTSTRGTTLNGITRAAEDLGLSARSIRASKSRLDELPLPAIVHWQGDHWVVLYRLERNHVRVADPESGLRRYTPRRVPRVVDRLRIGDRLRRGAGADAGAAGRASAGSSRSSART